ncbi:MAG: phosphate propanoyltransferase [Desulfitibacter sp. BRH_c19]|nr:MAG: phosphate propanoyltransferase [Desulfitibacter sp. BRH_c19]
MKITVGVSARHIHLSIEDMELLFGVGYELTPVRYLSIATQYICKERITVEGPKGKVENIAIIGPPREHTQVELSKTDAIKLGLNPPTRLSGDLEGSGSATLIGPNGSVILKDGLIVAQRHIHMTERDAEEFGFKHKDYAMVVVQGKRSLVFDFVVVRIAPENTHTEIHLDTDEANTADIKTGDEVTLFHVNDKKLRLEQIINAFDERQLRVLEQSVATIIEDEKQRISLMEEMLKGLKG